MPNWLIRQILLYQLINNKATAIRKIIIAMRMMFFNVAEVKVITNKVQVKSRNIKYPFWGIF